jgi:hypothetical protein
MPLNHANFNNATTPGGANGSFTSGNFGRVTVASPGRIGQMSLKFLW